jgi:hypothetical protein
MPARNITFTLPNSTTSMNDGGGLADDGGSGWFDLDAAFGHKMGISSNQGYNPDGGTGRAGLESSEADAEVEVTFPTVANTGDGSVTGVLARITDRDNFIEWVAYFGNNHVLRKNVAGGLTNLDTDSTAYANGDTFKITVSGTTIECRLNGTLIMSATDSFNQTATKHGVTMQGTTGRFDDFSITPVGGGGGAPLAVFANHYRQQGVV